MNIQISEDILGETISCEKNFYCLSGDPKELCEMESLNPQKVYFIKNPKDKRCIYTLSFGGSYICNCPTRREIYRRYRV